jgi:O-antigen/teichoic acid export membrane protein
LIFEKESLVKLSKFSNKIFIQGITGVLFTKLYFPLIGKFFSVSELGFYTTASNFSEIIVKQFTNAYNKVFFPVLSSIKNSTSFKSKYISIYSMLSIILVFISALAIIITPAFIEIVLGEKWLPSIIFMQLFLVEGLFFGLLMLNETIFNAKGDSGHSLRIDIIKKTLLMLSLFISYRYGIVWIIIGQVISTFITFIYSIFLVEKKYSIITKNLNTEYLKILFVATIIFSIDHFILQKYFKNIIYLFLGEISILPIIFILLIFILRIKGLKNIVIVSKKYLPLFIVNQFK